MQNELWRGLTDNKVETVEEFKLRFAAIISDKPEHIPGAPRPHSAAGPPQSHEALIRVYDATGNVTETHEHNGDFKQC